MTTVLERPAPAPVPPPAPGLAAPRPAPGAVAGATGWRTLAAGALVVVAVAPLARVYLGLGFLRPVGGAAVLAVVLAAVMLRARIGALGSLAASVAAWVLFTALAFLGTTLAFGFLPTPSTFSAGVRLWRDGMELVALRTSPTEPEAPLLLLTITGVWFIAHAVHELAVRYAAPFMALICALVIWVVPLAIAPAGARPWPWALAFALAAIGLLLASGADDRQRGRAPSGRLVAVGVPLGLAAVAIGVVVGARTPGYDAEPWYEVRGIGGTTITTNPIVDIRQRLVATDTGPVLRVTSPRPVYLRTTSLDLYNEREEWTSSGISGRPVSGEVPQATSVPFFEQVALTVELDGIAEGSILAPAPYQPVTIGGPTAEVMQYDGRSSTFTVDQGQVLRRGDLYDITAHIPTPDVDLLREIRPPVGPDPLTTLPPNVPPEVAALARSIVDEAGAVTMFDQALAVQNRLRTWTYSLNPAAGHGSTAMLQFLDSQEGYCEQFAGTMAVMLRSLNIPARLVVGYTPGELGPDQRWVVTNANAHAWVEVAFGDLGFIAFEPTPRNDGNVLVPTADAVAPGLTAAQATGGAARPAPQPGEIPRPADEDFQSLEDAAGLPPQVPEGTAPTGSGGAAVQVVLLALLGVTVMGLVLGRRRLREARDPLLRIALARRSVEDVGRAVGKARGLAETDAEYFTRVAPGHRSSLRLANVATAVTYAPHPPRSAREAELAALELRGALLTDLPAPRRSAVLSRVRLVSARRQVVEGWRSVWMRVRPATRRRRDAAE